MGSVTEFLEKYQGPIQGLFETGSDIKVTNNLEKYMKDLEERKADHDRIQKFQDITMKLSRLDKNTLPKTKKVAIETFANTDIPEFKNTEFAKKYDEYLTKISKTGEDGKPIPGQYFTNPKDVDTFLKEHPESEKLVEELRTKNFYKPTEKEVNMTADEWEQNMYNTIGVTPEEAAWYKEEMKNKRDNDVNNYNQKLMRMVAERLPGLMSQGSLKNTYAEMFGNIAGTYMIEPPKYTEPKKKKLDDYSTAELKNFSAEQILSSFNSTDAYKHIWDFNDKAREEIFKQFPNWKKEEKTKSLRDYNKEDWDNLEKNPALLDKIQWSDWENNYDVLPSFAKEYVDKNFPDIGKKFAEKEKSKKTRGSGFRGGKLTPTNIEIDIAEYLDKSAQFDKTYGKWDNSTTDDKQKQAQNELSNRRKLIKENYEYTESQIDEMLSTYRKGDKLNPKDVKSMKEEAPKIKEAASDVWYKQKSINKNGKSLTFDEWIRTFYTAKDINELSDWLKEFRSTLEKAKGKVDDNVYSLLVDYYNQYEQDLERNQNYDAYKIEDKKERENSYKKVFK